MKKIDKDLDNLYKAGIYLTTITFSMKRLIKFFIRLKNENKKQIEKLENLKENKNVK